LVGVRLQVTPVVPLGTLSPVICQLLPPPNETERIGDPDPVNWMPVPLAIPETLIVSAAGFADAAPES
jgi:hypothetical protein